MGQKGQEYKESIKDHLNEFAETVSHPFEDLEDKTIRLSTNAIDKAKKIKAEVNKKLT